jgi:hypothetical protein
MASNDWPLIDVHKYVIGLCAVEAVPAVRDNFAVQATQRHTRPLTWRESLIVPRPVHTCW